MESTLSPAFTVTENVVVNGSATETEDAGEPHVFVPMSVSAGYANAPDPNHRTAATCMTNSTTSRFPAISFSVSNLLVYASAQTTPPCTGRCSSHLRTI